MVAMRSSRSRVIALLGGLELLRVVGLDPIQLVLVRAVKRGELPVRLLAQLALALQERIAPLACRMLPRVVEGFLGPLGGLAQLRVRVRERLLLRGALGVERLLQVGLDRRDLRLAAGLVLLRLRAGLGELLGARIELGLGARVASLEVLADLLRLLLVGREVLDAALRTIELALERVGLLLELGLRALERQQLVRALEDLALLLRELVAEVEDLLVLLVECLAQVEKLLAGDAPDRLRRRRGEPRLEVVDVALHALGFGVRTRDPVRVLACTRELVLRFREVLFELAAARLELLHLGAGPLELGRVYGGARRRRSTLCGHARDARAGRHGWGRRARGGRGLLAGRLRVRPVRGLEARGFVRSLEHAEGLIGEGVDVRVDLPDRLRNARAERGRPPGDLGALVLHLDVRERDLVLDDDLPLALRVTREADELLDVTEQITEADRLVDVVLRPSA
jgi:hypothetical protein